MKPAAEYLLEHASLDDDGWAAAVAVTHGVDAAVLGGVLDGTKATPVLPAPVAVLTLGRIHPRDLAAAHRATVGETRSTVLKHLAALQQAADTADAAEAAEPAGPVTFPAALASVRSILEAAAHEEWARRVASVAQFLATLTDPKVAARVAVAVLSGDVTPRLNAPSDDWALLRTAGRFTYHVSRDTVLAIAAAPAPAQVRYATLAAAVNANVNMNHDVDGLVSALGHPAAEVASAAAWLVGFGDKPLDMGPVTVRGHWLAARLFAWAASNGVQLRGPGSVAEQLGLPDDLSAVAPDNADAALAVDVLISTAARLDDENAVAAIAEEVTEGGACQFELPSLRLDRAASLITPAVAIAALPHPRTASVSRVRTAAVAAAAGGEHGHCWSEADVRAALETFPEFAARFWRDLPGADGVHSALPAWMFAEGCRRAGLNVWLRNGTVALDRLTAAATGIGPSRWAALLMLLDDHRGTPEELVEVTAAVAPETTGT